MGYFKTVIKRLKSFTKKINEVPNPVLTALGTIRDGSKIIDVIFIHGLGGDSRTTWNSGKDDSTFWPLWLGQDLERIQPWTLSWPASPVKQTMPISDRAINILALLRARNIGDRPIIFICHSLGGLLVKRILRCAKDLGNQEWEKISNQTQGVIFLGTPHTGAIYPWITKLAHAFKINIPNHILEKNDPDLRNLNLWFRAFATPTNIAILSLTESVPLFSKQMVVDQGSADPGILDSIPISIDCGHTGICKPISRESQVYVLSLEFIRTKTLSLTKRDPTGFIGKVKAFFDSYLFSATGPIAFGGRKLDLDLLDNWLIDEQAPNRLLITGPTGRGKSALLVRWINSLFDRTIANNDTGTKVVFVPISMRFETNLPSVFYYSLATQLAAVFNEVLLAPSIDPEAYYAEQATTFLQRINETEEHVLVIIDGVDEALDGRFSSSIFPLKARPNLKILVSARFQAGDRDSNGWLQRLNWDSVVRVSTHELVCLNEEGIKDALQRMGAPLDELSPQIVHRLWQLTGGEPLLVQLYAEELWKMKGQPGSLTLDGLHGLTPGFASYFKRYIDCQRSAWGKERQQINEHKIDTVLAVLACAFGPIEKEHFVSLVNNIDSSQPSFSADDLLRPIRRFVMGEGDSTSGYVFNHPKLAQYILEEHLTTNAADKAHRAFADWGRNTLKEIQEQNLPAEDIPHYLLQFYTKHLELTEAAKEDFTALINNTWRQAWERFEGGYKGFKATLFSVLKILGPTKEANPNYSWAVEKRILAALCLSSIRSIGANIPNELLELALNERILTLPQALHYVELQIVANRPQYLASIASYLPNDELESAINLILEDKTPSNRAQFIVNIVKRTTGQRQKELAAVALEIALALGDMQHQARLLIELSMFLEGDSKLLALRKAREIIPIIQDAGERVSLYVLLLNSFDLGTDKNAIIQTALVSLDMMLISNTLQEAILKGEALLKLAPILSKEERDSRIPGFINLLNFQYEQGLLRQNQRKMRQPTEASLFSIFHLFKIMSALKLEIAKELPKEKVGSLIQEILASALITPHQYFVINALVDLTEFIPKNFKDDYVRTCFEQTKKLGSGNNRTHSMMKLASLSLPPLRQLIIRESLRNATLIEDNWSKAGLLTRLLSLLPIEVRSNELQFVIQSVQSISYVLHQAESYLDLAPLLAAPQETEQLYNTAINLMGLLQDSLERRVPMIRALEKLPAAHRATLFEKLFQVIKANPALWIEIHMLAQIAGDLWTQEHLDYALGIFAKAPEAYAREALFTSILPIAMRLKQNSIIDIGLAFLVKPTNVTSQITILTAMSSFLEFNKLDELIEDAVQSAQSLPSAIEKCNALLKLVPILSETKQKKILRDIQTLASNVDIGNRCSLHQQLSKYLFNGEKQQLLKLTYSEIKLVPDELRASVMASLLGELTNQYDRLDGIDLISEAAAFIPRISLYTQLELLVPIFLEIGGIPLIRAIMLIIVETSEWWP